MRGKELLFLSHFKNNIRPISFRMLIDAFMDELGKIVATYTTELIHFETVKPLNAFFEASEVVDKFDFYSFDFQGSFSFSRVPFKSLNILYF